jgi:hypothetical protein
MEQDWSEVWIGVSETGPLNVLRAAVALIAFWGVGERTRVLIGEGVLVSRFFVVVGASRWDMLVRFEAILGVQFGCYVN